MKIAFVQDGIYAYASGSPRAVGGAERNQWLLARALVENGWSATVGVRDLLKVGERKIIDGVEYVGIGHGQVLLAWHKFLTAERPNWLFWACAYHLWGTLVEIAKLGGIRTIFHAAFDSDVETRKAWGLSRTDKIFVQHERQLSRLSPQLRSKAYILPKVCMLAGADGDTVPVKPHAERERYVAWVAMLRQHKRPDVLIEIARKLPAIRFVVCGGPSTLMSAPDYSERIINELRKTANIEYLGQVPPDKAQQLIAEAALLLSTSDTEGFPNTFVQAWSSGTPVVSLKIDPDRNIQRLGLGAVSHTVERAVADITALIDSSDRRDSIGSRARSFIVENHSAATVVRLFEDALSAVS
jgi:glycosyltransferase involved in cell wall biosynthesis